MRRTLGVAVVVTVLAVGLLAVGPAQADQIFVCQSCTTPPGGPHGNPVSNPTSFNVGLAGNATDQSPLLIVVAVYDGNGTPSISFNGTMSEPMATLGTYGLTKNMTSITTGDVFDAIGLTQAGGSESFGNLSTADMLQGFAAPTSFTLDVFAVPTGLTGTISIDESGASNGSIILAFSCKAGTGSSSGCAKNGDVSQTVDTNMGILTGGGPGPTPTPEPGSLALLGTGLLSMAGVLRRRFVKS